MQQALKACRLSTKRPAETLQEEAATRTNTVTGRQKLRLKLVTRFYTSALTQTDTRNDESNVVAFGSARAPGDPRCHREGKRSPNVLYKNPSRNPAPACSMSCSILPGDCMRLLLHRDCVVLIMTQNE
ncbi:uncharacterized [Tachysurus ichikawai]